MPAIKILFTFISVAQVVLATAEHAFDNDNDEDALTADDYAMMSIMSEGLMHDEELLCFFALDTFCAAESQSEHKRYPRFNPEILGTVEFRKYFRFEKKDIVHLCSTLAIPDTMYSASRVTWTGVEGLCILLRRLAYPNCLCDLVPMFGRSKSEISEIVNEMLFYLCAVHKNKFSTLQQPCIDHALFC